MTIIPGHERPDSPEQPAGAGFHGAAIAADPPGSGRAWRALDASANRAAEALRVIEDVLRFVLDDAHLTAVAKRLRHDLGEDVVRTGADHEVVDLGHCLDEPSYRLHIAFDSNSDHRRSGEPKLHRIGDRDNLHDPGLLKPLDPLPDCGLREANRLAD